MPWCPKCKAEYREGFTKCASCDVTLVDELPEQTEEELAPPETSEGVQLREPIAVYTAESRVNAEMVRDVLRDSGLAVAMQRVLLEHSGAVTGKRARYGVALLVESADTAKARALIDELKQALEQEELDEDELARLAEEQSMETPEQPVEDSASLKLLPVVLGVIVAALALLYLVSNRM